MPGLAERRAAADAVAAVLAREARLDEALRTEDLPANDAALARAIAVATFRRFGTIRAALHARLAKGLPADPALLAILATGAAQILVLDVPDHAAVDLSVRLASARRRTAHLTGLVNAVLRRLARERDAIPLDGAALAELPDWLARRWREHLGPQRAESAARAGLAGAPLDLTVKHDPEGWAERLDGAVLPTGSVRLRGREAVSDLPGFADGEWWVQDAAAALPARLLGVRPGERVLDLCAAPGGKTAQLAAAGARVTALDRSASRLERLAGNLDRLRLSADIACADALAYEAEPFDAVLLDAPCTATGTLRRHPDVAWGRDMRDVATLAGLQAALFDRAVRLVRPGGRLVYCVCSLEPEEGERQVAAALARHPGLARRPIALPGLASGWLTTAGDLRTLPDDWPPAEPDGRGGLDGFFAASLQVERA